MITYFLRLLYNKCMFKGEGKKKKNNSLAKRVTNTAITVALFVAFVGLIVGTISFVWTLLGENMTDTFFTLGTAVVVSKDIADTKTMAEEVLTTYRGLSEEERATTGTAEYRRNYSRVCELEDYKQLEELLVHYQSINSLESIYFVAYDKDTNAIIHVIDTGFSDDPIYGTGDWEYIDPKDVEKLHNFKYSMPYIIHRNSQGTRVATTGVRLRDSQKATYGFLMADYDLEEMNYDIVMFLIRYIIAIVVVSIFFAFFLNRHFGRTLAGPINIISTAAQNYIISKKAGNTSVGIFSSLDINTGDEIENLSHVMADMESDISDYMEDLTEMTAKEERVKAELSMASKIQASSLPDPKSAIADSERFSLYADMKPAKTVGGDFYDFFMTDDDHLAFVIADVSDKGVPAALFMMSAKNLINYRAREGGTPAQILSSVNAQLCRNNGSRMFVTVWLGILDTTCGRLLYANAGHEPIAISHEGEGFEFVTGAKKPAVGIISGIDYTDQELMLMPQDKVFLYTDGITEAADDKGAFFGSDRLIDALNTSDGSPADVINSVGDSITSFVKDAEQFDDMTMLCLLFKSKGEG